MDETVTFEDRGNYVVCTQGRLGTMATMLDASRRMNDWCTEHQRFRALWDLRGCTFQMSIIDRFEVAAQAATFWNRRIRLAAWLREDQVMPDRFVQTAANNRGIPIKVCLTFDEAMAWLGVGATSDSAQVDTPVRQ